MTRTATKIIHIDERSVKDILDGLYRALSKKNPQEIPGKQENIHSDFLSLKHVTGTDQPILVNFNTKPGRSGLISVGGTLSFLGHRQPVVSVWLNGSMTWGVLADRKASEHAIRVNLLHELTHAVDQFKETATSGPNRLVDIDEVDPRRYYNDPAEVRAYMRSLYEEIAPMVLLQMKGPLLQKWGVGKIITIALRNSALWKQMEKHLSPANRNRILKGLVTSFEVHRQQRQAFFRRKVRKVLLIDKLHQLLWT